MSRPLAPAPLAVSRCLSATHPASQKAQVAGAWSSGVLGRCGLSAATARPAPSYLSPPLAVQQPGAEEPPHQCGALDPHPAEPGARVGRPRRCLLPGEPSWAFGVGPSPPSPALLFPKIYFLCWVLEPFLTVSWT